ncbi:hypothetical protein [Synoicihabitans lomoniglobus]|uniref:Uncharacterized protein n=1 Tax=Synoicihabitans lomoniglobus TaxID=2909285 RepID=A0AAE9ZUG9_9BACT|nr:hypothetical protein [Opitutaceae bacterium LMO-M01]WED63254.1 hypothetical protein PXH66_13030 [Opitutaceae bacterium LMO-M01]
MRTGRSRLTWGWSLLLAGGLIAQTIPDAQLDLATKTTATAEVVRDDYQLHVTAEFDANTQKLSVTGRVETAQAIEPRSYLSYQVYGDDGSLEMADGARYPWTPTADGTLVAGFDLDLPMVLRNPAVDHLQVSFNAVVEGEYWYRDEKPEIAFPSVSIAHIPPRDWYQPQWSWLPRILPAQTRLHLPARWSWSGRDAARGDYTATAEVWDVDSNTRVESPRLGEVEWKKGATAASMWLPVTPLTSGHYRVRPGLVWDQVRWYDAGDWFTYREVRVVPPLWYLTGVVALVVMLWTGWIRAWVSTRWRGPVRVVVVVAAVWLLAHLVVTGYWFMVLALVLARVVINQPWSRTGERAYALTMVFFTFLEIYWAMLSAVVSVWPTAVVYSIALWAVVLLPLVVIRRAWLAWSVAALASMGWLLTSTAVVIYYQFFQDFPSVSNLLYANQVGDVGDSVLTLVQQRHFIPLLVAVAMATMVVMARRSSAGAESADGDSSVTE